MNKAEKVIKFIELLKHTQGKWAGKPFALLDWQKDVIIKLYGTLKADGFRQYEYCYLEIPKKNGKTELAAALALYHLFADGEMGGEVYSCAAEREQASIAFNVAVEMVQQCPALKKRTQMVESKKLMVDKKTKSKYKALSAEAFSKHGLKPSAVIFDELHAQPSRDLWDVMTFGAGDVREQPLWVVITTAGDDPDKTSIGWEVHDKAKRILKGEYIDPRWLCYIYGLEEGDDPWDEVTWYKVNPSLGITINIDKVRAAADDAKQSPAEERLFRWLRLNEWVDTKAIDWISLTLWDKTAYDLDRSILVGKRCFAGLDLSSTIDLTGLALVFPPQDGLTKWHTIFYGWIPEIGMNKRVRLDKVPYRIWVNQGFLVATQGDAIDYSYIEAKLVELSKLYDIEKVATDTWNSRMLTQRLHNKGLDCIEVAQTMAGMSPAMKFIETEMRRGEIQHEVNPLARWCFGNVAIAVDGNENKKTMKDKSADRIDLCVAWINAMAVAMVNEEGSVYEDRGLISL
jgi:phage terminase large subunit-like protein